MTTSPTATNWVSVWRSRPRPGEDFRYDLSFEEFLKAAFTDEVRTHDGLKVIIPGDDVALLTGATLDYTSTQGLVIRNPNKPAAPNVEGLISDDELSAEVDALVATEVNPALAAHGGFVTYVGHDGEGTAYMTMGGGCHGCSMSKMTMLDGVQTMLSEAIEGIEQGQGPHRSHHRREPVLLLTLRCARAGGAGGRSAGVLAGREFVEHAGRDRGDLRHGPFERLLGRGRGLLDAGDLAHVLTGPGLDLLGGRRGLQPAQCGDVAAHQRATRSWRSGRSRT